MNQANKILYRSRSNRMIGGVAAGIGDYLGLDPTIVRLLFVFAALVGWVAPAVIVYLVMLFVVPEEPLATGTSPAPAAVQPAPPVETLPEEIAEPARPAAGAGVYDTPPAPSQPGPEESTTMNESGAGI